MNSLWQLWQITAARHPSKPVVVEAETGHAWTCAELLEQSLRQSAMLPRDCRGRCITFCLPNSAEWLLRFLAIQQRGAVALALDPSLSPEAQEQTSRKLGAHFLWATDGLRLLAEECVLPQRICHIKTTSATTGELKPVPCAAGNLIADGRHIIRTMRIRPSDRNLAMIPLGHSYGIGNLVMPLLLQATELVCVRTLVPREILHLIERHRVTVFPSVPAVFRALGQLENATKPPSLRLVISAGAPLSAEVARQFHQRYGLKIHNFYGSSETGGICYDRTGNATLKGRSVGKPLHGVTVRICRDGRIAVRSAAGTFTLPDLGKWNRYGELGLMGRLGQMANIGGKKVSPAEVERALRALRGVSDAWVTVLADKRGNDCLAAAAETARDRVEIERELMQSLPPWKLPRSWVIAAVLPRTDRGKLHTAELKARLLAAIKS
jgi:acyl-coenzyme A synthetase/AMP-(fatty) acid ligase